MIVVHLGLSVTPASLSERLVLLTVNMTTASDLDIDLNKHEKTGVAGLTLSLSQINFNKSLVSFLRWRG